MPYEYVLESEDGEYVFSRPVKQREIVGFAKKLLKKTIREDVQLENSASTRALLTLELGGEEREVFCCLFLTNQHHLISFDRMFYGTIDGAAVYPREVVKRALSRNAAAVILAHNHPSGVPEPSQADIAITGRVKEALSLVDIRVLDHIVVGNAGVVSLAERRLL